MYNNMRKILPFDYQGDRYGLTYRFVNESDAEFIYRLRSDATISKYIHDIQGGVEQQVEWIKSYKERETAGKEYYFIFYRHEEPIGLFRLYSFKEKTFTSGSWVMVPNSPLDAVVAIPLICREIAFFDLGMEFEDNYDACHVDNKKVIKFNQKFGCIIYKHFQDVKGEYVAMSLTKEDFIKKRPGLLKLIGIKE